MSEQHQQSDAQRPRSNSWNRQKTAPNTAPASARPADRVVRFQRGEDGGRRHESEHRQSADPQRQNHQRRDAQPRHPFDYCASRSPRDGTVNFAPHDMPEPSLPVLQNIATQLRIDSVRSTTEAGSGHPTTCLSAADIIAALFFAEMRFDPHDPQHPEADRFVLSKGHAAPILYAAWAAAGAFPREDVLKLRALDSDLEGHPTPRLPFVDVATGSLGQGLCGRRRASRSTRGASNPTTAPTCCSATASRRKGRCGKPRRWRRTTSSTTCARITDVNGFGQSRATQWDRDIEAYASRWRAFGWHTVSIDGHDMKQVAGRARRGAPHTGRPTMIVARTLKGKGVRALRRQGRLARQAAEEGRGSRCGDRGARSAVHQDTAIRRPSFRSPRAGARKGRCRTLSATLPTPAYKTR